MARLGKGSEGQRAVLSLYLLVHWTHAPVPMIVSAHVETKRQSAVSQTHFQRDPDFENKSSSPSSKVETAKRTGQVCDTRHHGRFSFSTRFDTPPFNTTTIAAEQRSLVVCCWIVTWHRSWWREGESNEGTRWEG